MLVIPEIKNRFSIHPLAVGAVFRYFLKGFFTLMVFSHDPQNGKTPFDGNRNPFGSRTQGLDGLNHWHITQNHAVPQYFRYLEKYDILLVD